MVNLVCDQTLGIAPKFLKRKTVIKKLKTLAEQRITAFSEKNHRKVQNYLSFDSKASPDELDEIASVAAQCLMSEHQALLARSLTHALETKSWDNCLRAEELQLIRCRELLGFYFSHKIRPKHQPNYMRAPSMGHYLGQLCLINDLAEFQQTTALYFNAHDRGYMSDTEKYRGQRFMLRLAASFCRFDPGQWHSYSYDTPLYNEILEHWQDENPAQLQALLLKACHRHTYQSCVYDEDGERDWGGYYSHLPIEILMVQRLRQWRGLSAAPIDHILMEAPFNKLPYRCEYEVRNPLAEQFMLKVRQDFPDFDAVIAEGIQRESVA